MLSETIPATIIKKFGNLVVVVIMSNLLTGIAPAAGLVAQSSHQTSAHAARGTEGNTAQTTANQRVVSSGAVSNPAVLVSISSDAKARSPSYGAGKSVDPGFEKQKMQDRREESDGKETSPTSRKGKTVSVTA